ncbi:hypothetical protein THAOC_13150 [Thalassiosira oceanica]|uniref:DNA-directed RNA polymerase III subunit n=1 Tax=Thalassiosira oceanica TaxID=159749 RepID=K0T678_THAOC|nr:hypothetical protein THAOC_13150 [Thalassiosira oceanica]|mmetsp:Transcript_21260/g.49921  ORF Transcript_21260/g.49921 Transcript_21260/m.49921 type:complete len:274 (+) Transcript_21260:54-875(+)|eukprot:EJK65947.1 hypothetical protein THAOC_13150 [Thalassiosira oceanica]
MSGRGRGRGRGRGAGPKSASQQYLLASASEAGLDVRTLRGQSTSQIFPDFELHSSGERRLLPHEKEHLYNLKNNKSTSVVKEEGGNIKVKSEDSADVDEPNPVTSTERPKSPRTIYLISKQREIQHRFHTSAFYVRTGREVPDVERYSDRLKPPPIIDSSTVLSHCLGGQKRTRGPGGGVFVPEELCGGQRRGNAAKEDGQQKKARGLNLAELARKIKRDQGDADDDEEKQDDDDGADFAEDSPASESEGEDYVKDYYDSDDESEGSGGEPTY